MLKRSVSGGRSSGGGKNEESSAPAASPPAAAAAAAAAGAGAGAPQEERTNYLVALAGMKALTSHVQDVKKGRTWKERVKGWEEKAGLTEPSVKLALGFLDILGVRSACFVLRCCCFAAALRLEARAWVGEGGWGPTQGSMHVVQFGRTVVRDTDNTCVYGHNGGQDGR